MVEQERGEKERVEQEKGEQERDEQERVKQEREAQEVWERPSRACREAGRAASRGEGEGG